MENQPIKNNRRNKNNLPKAKLSSSVKAPGYTATIKRPKPFTGILKLAAATAWPNS